MLAEVELWYIEMFTNIEVDKDSLILMKYMKRIGKLLQGIN
jgi:hypothetical protein